MVDSLQMLELAAMTSGTARETYGKDTTFIQGVDIHFPEDWDLTQPRAKNVLTVIEIYLRDAPAPARERLEEAFSKAATKLPKQEPAIRRSCGRNLYDKRLTETYVDQFFKDLKRFEEDWTEFQTEQE